MKSLKRILCLLLVLAMAISLAACSGKSDEAAQTSSEAPTAATAATNATLAGTWHVSIDLSDMLTTELTAADPSLASYFHFESFIIDMYMVFGQDGTYSMYADPDTLETAWDAVKAEVEAGLYLYLQDELQTQGLGDYTVDEYLKESGTDMADLMESTFGSMDTEALAADFQAEGRYVIDGNRLYTSSDPDVLPSQETYEFFVLEGNTLTFDAPAGSDTALAAFYPLTLKKN